MKKLNFKDIENALAAKGVRLAEEQDEWRGVRRTKLRGTCKCGAKFYRAIPRIEIEGHFGCRTCQKEEARKRNYDDAIARLREHGCKPFSKYKDFPDRKAKLRYLCSCGEKSEREWQNIMYREPRCNSCAYEEAAGKRSLDIDTIKKRIEAHGGSLVSGSPSSFGDKTPIKILHRCGHLDERTVEQFLASVGDCRKCGIEKRNANIGKTQEEIAEVISATGNLLITPINMLNTNTPIQVECRGCGQEYTATYTFFRTSSKYKLCSSCTLERKSKRLTLSYDEIKKRLKNEYGARLLTKKGDYKNRKQRIKIECPSCKKPFNRWPHLLSRVGVECRNCSKKRTSSIELAMHKILDDAGIPYQKNVWDIVTGELDIYIPDRNLAVEVNGLYWHSEARGRGRDYHLAKTLECAEKGVQLIHIFESEIRDKTEIIESMILSRVGKAKKIYGRKTECRRIEDAKVVRAFLDKNHIQGDLRTIGAAYGLYRGDTLVSVATFGKARYSQHEWECLRFCSKLGHNIMGGFSKMFKAFVTDADPKSVITYSDLRFGTGKVYEKAGFEHSHDSTPNYFYIVDGNLESRVKYQKHKLEGNLENFDPELTERENMANHRYHRIWDCGNRVYVWNKQ